MQRTLVIFSGLPGTGKSLLSSTLATQLGLPLLRIDDLVARMPDSWLTFDIPFWDSTISMLLRLVEAQLELGLSVMVDSVFMAYDRQAAQAIAQRHQALFRPVYTLVSDETVWKQRLTVRHEALGKPDDVATWERVQRQRLGFLPWQPGTALFVDAVCPVEQNIAVIRDYITNPEVELTPLADVPMKQAGYHV